MLKLMPHLPFPLSMLPTFNICASLSQEPVICAAFVQACHSCVMCLRARKTLGRTFPASPGGEAESLSFLTLMAIDVSEGEDTALFCATLAMSLRDSTGISGCARCKGSENQSETQRVALQWSLPTTTHVALLLRCEQLSLPTNAHLEGGKGMCGTRSMQ